MKAELLSCGVRTEAQGRRGEAGVKGLVSRWQDGPPPRKERAGCGGSSYGG